MTELNFARLNWGDDEAVQLAVVLPLCAKLTELKLQVNQVGDKGAAALAGAIKGNGVVKTLFLRDNHIGDAGAAAIADAFNKGAIAQTGEFLYFQGNPITDEGKECVAKACRGKVRAPPRPAVPSFARPVPECCRSTSRPADPRALGLAAAPWHARARGLGLIARVRDLWLDS